MPSRNLRFGRSPSVLAAWSLIACLLGPGYCMGAQPDRDPFTGPNWADKYQPASTCTECHTKPTKTHVANGTLRFVLMTEASIWRTHDKHAQAYASLLNDRSRQIGEALRLDVRAPEAGCMNCHAMANVFGKRTPMDLDLKPPDGVSCGGCHGPSKDWKDTHGSREWRHPVSKKEWRLLGTKERGEMGFRDLRDPETKATLCMSCHIGNAAEGKVVTHAMFAAGHPPLPPIEIAQFTKNQPQHWRDSRDVPLFRDNPPEDLNEIYHLEDLNFQGTKLALIGSVVALRETMKLVRDRANFEAPAQWWPELLAGQNPAAPKDAATVRSLAQQRWPQIAMAHSDCYACHHELQNPSYRQERGFGYRVSWTQSIRSAPGRPLVRGWPIALLHAATDYVDRPKKADELLEALQAVVTASSARPFGKPADLGKAAQKAIDWCNVMIGELHQASYNRDRVEKLIFHLCRMYDPPATGKTGKDALPFLPDYEAARQVTSLLSIASAEWRSSERKWVDDQLRKLADQVSLQPYTKRTERLRIILKVVEKAADEKNLKGMDEFSEYLLTPGNLGNEEKLAALIPNPFLTVLRDQLTDKSFTQALLEARNDLQKLSDEELAEVLKGMAAYDPREFLENLRKLTKSLQAKK